MTGRDGGARAGRTRLLRILAAAGVVAVTVAAWRWTSWFSPGGAGVVVPPQGAPAPLLAGPSAVDAQGVEPGTPPGRPEPGVRTVDVHLVGRHRGERQWEIRATSIRLPDRAKRVEFDHVTDGVFYRNGTPAWHFEGDGGLFDEENGRLELAGAFSLWNDGQDRIETRDLAWDAERRRLSTDSPVVMRHGEMRAQAESMVIDVASDVVHLLGRVRLDEPGRLSVTGPAVDYVAGSGEIRLVGPFTIEATPSGEGGS